MNNPTPHLYCAKRSRLPMRSKMAGAIQDGRDASVTCKISPCILTKAKIRGRAISTANWNRDRTPCDTERRRSEITSTRIPRAHFPGVAFRDRDAERNGRTEAIARSSIRRRFARDIRYPRAKGRATARTSTRHSFVRDIRERRDSRDRGARAIRAHPRASAMGLK